MFKKFDILIFKRNWTFVPNICIFVFINCICILLSFFYYGLSSVKHFCLYVPPICIFHVFINYICTTLISYYVRAGYTVYLGEGSIVNNILKSLFQLVLIISNFGGYFLSDQLWSFLYLLHDMFGKEFLPGVSIFHCCLTNHLIT